MHPGHRPVWRPVCETPRSGRTGSEIGGHRGTGERESRMMSRSAFEARLSALEQAVLPRPQVQVPDACTLMTRAVGPPDPWQVQVLTSQAARTLLNCSRQSGKSATVAVLALHTALVQPGSLTLLLSPSLRQSQELFRKVADAYRALGHPAPLEAESALRYEL